LAFCVAWIVFEFSGSFIVGFILFLLVSLVFGCFFATVALEPVVRINEEIDTLLKESLHELKIPIATILNNVEMLQSRNLEDREKRMVERIAISAKRARDEQDRVLSILKSSIGEDIREEFCLESVIKESITPFLDYKSVKFELLLGEGVTFFGDKIGFLRAITNIVENSVKFKKNSVNIKIVYEHPFLSVSDNGMGIEKDDLLKIFDRFYKVDRPESGFGLGLFIVKSYCDKNGIKVYIDSKIGEGTTLSLDLSPLSKKPNSL